MNINIGIMNTSAFAWVIGPNVSFNFKGFAINLGLGPVVVSIIVTWG